MTNTNDTPPPSVTQPDTDASSNQTISDSWRYISTIPPIPAPFSALLDEYSHIPPPDQPAHILHAREQAYAKNAYPCLGRFRFLQLDLSLHPLYQSHVVPLLRRPSGDFNPPHNPVFLDVGTCLGQDLRKLVFDGVDVSRVYGSDLSWSNIDAGYELFRDEERFPRDRFLVPGDVLGRRDENVLPKLEGKCDAVHVQAVFHLFDLADQKTAADQVVRLLRRDPGQKALLFGAQVGMTEPQPSRVGTSGRESYRHNIESWKLFWDEVLGSDRWKGVVESWEVGGSLEDAKRYQQNADDSGQEVVLKWIFEGYRWQLWWVWIQFR